MVDKLAGAEAPASRQPVAAVDDLGPARRVERAGGGHVHARVDLASDVAVETAGVQAAVGHDVDREADRTVGAGNGLQDPDLIVDADLRATPLTGEAHAEDAGGGQRIEDLRSEVTALLHGIRVVADQRGDLLDAADDLVGGQGGGLIPSG